MNVKELIEKLSKCVPEKEVFVWTPEGERIEATSVDDWRDGDETDPASGAVDINCGEK